MRYLPILAFLVSLASPLSAQEPPQPAKPKFLVKIDQVRVGFKPYKEGDMGSFKIGMWSPVYVDVTAGPKPPPIDPNNRPFLQIETPDSEGVGTIYRVPGLALEPGESRTLIGYVKPGNYNDGQKVDVTLHWNDKTYAAPPQFGSPLLDFHAHVYLSLGSRIPEFREALVALAQGGGGKGIEVNERDTSPRYAVFETDVGHLPENWVGYQGLDLMVLNTDRKEFLGGLLKDANRPRLKAISQWVRRGGRLIIPVNYLNQDLLAKVLESPVWQPAVPVIPPANPGDAKKSTVKSLPDIVEWAEARGKPFTGPFTIAKLDPGNVPAGAWKVMQDKTGDHRPLIARLPYGLGSITYIAFSLDQPPFSQWEGRSDFLKTMVGFLAPLVRPAEIQDGRFFRGERAEGTDLTTNLQRAQENGFDVNVIPFGYVALFILLYILMVGPLDYFVLKHVFQKLEWTWITFPTVVLAVSVAAYFTAYALKGNDLKINKVDLVDFDLRTDLDAKQQPARAFAYGQTFFTILSPRIQNYTVGIEPNPAFWGAKEGASPLSADMVSWLGRPEFDGFGGMGSARSQGFFRRPYTFAEDARGVRALPIPVWTTKTLTAAWEAPLPNLPFQADLVYHTNRVDGRDVKITGSFKNDLGVDLEDVWFFYGGKAFQVQGGFLKGAQAKIVLQESTMNLEEWWKRGQALGPGDAGFPSSQGTYDPTSLVKQALFFEKMDNANNARNFNLRPLDQSWRVEPETLAQDGKLRETIVYARVRSQRGPAETLTAAASAPTHLWLGALPGDLDGRGNVLTRPPLAGNLTQDTYVRILLPVRPAPPR